MIKRQYWRWTSALALGIGFVPGPVLANPPCYARGGHLYCGNNAPTPIYEFPRYTDGGRPTRKVDTLKSNPSYFECFARGAKHGGGNNIWYVTYGDETKAWGYVPAVKVWTPKDPFDGVSRCRR